MGMYDCFGDEPQIKAERDLAEAARQDYLADSGEPRSSLPDIADTLVASIRGYLITIDWHFCWTGHEEYVLNSVTINDCPEGNLIPILSDKFLQDCIDAVRADHLKLLARAEDVDPELLANDAKIDEPWNIPGLALQNHIERRIQQLPMVEHEERRRAHVEAYGRAAA